MTTIMQGFPPAEADRATLANWRNRPWCAWAFHHVREIVPTAEIANDPDDVWALETGAADFDTDALAEAMAATDTDAVAVIRDGELIHESYRNGMTAAAPHILFSVSKSMTGLIAGTCVERGEIDTADPVLKYVPELAGTVYEDANLRHLLDMRIGVKFEEDYLATTGPIVDYRYAANWNVVPPGREAGDLRSFMSSLVERDGPHGRPHHYVSPNVDLMAWVMERATGVRFADLVSERLFRPVGAERPGEVTVDRIGGVRAAGGMGFTARDLARIGAMLANGGRREGRQVIAESWIDDIVNADPQSWRDSDKSEQFDDQDRAYRAYWYVVRGDEPMIHGLGIHGQYLFVDIRRNLSIAWFSSMHDPLNDAARQRVFAAVDAIRGVAS